MNSFVVEAFSIHVIRCGKKIWEQFKQLVRLHRLSDGDDTAADAASVDEAGDEQEIIMTQD